MTVNKLINRLNDEISTDKMHYTRHHLAVFVITYVSFAVIHSARKSLSNTKNVISEEWTSASCNSTWPCSMPSSIWRCRNLFESYTGAAPFLGLLDTTFLLCYSIGLILSSAIANRVEQRIFLAVGMTLSGIFMFFFGFISEWFQLYNKTYYVIFWSLEGFAQAICFPTSVAIITNWFSHSNRGMVFGIWMSCCAIGNMLGNVITVILIEFGYEYVFLCNSLFTLCCGVIIFFGLVRHPSDIDLPAECHRLLEPTTENTPIENPIDDSTSVGRATSSEAFAVTLKVEPLSFWKTLLLPGVIPYSLCLMFLKAVKYGLLFWLPYYMVNKFKWNDSVSAGISTWFDVGGIIGSIFMGVVLDKTKLRIPIALCILVMSPVSLWIYNASRNNYIVNSFLLTFLGFTIDSMYFVLISVGAELGKQEAIGTNRNAAASVVGIVIGISCIVSAVVQYPIAVIGNEYGWDWVFFFFIFLIVFSILAVFPIFYHEVKNYACTRHMIDKVKFRFNPYTVLKYEDS